MKHRFYAITFLLRLLLRNTWNNGMVPEKMNDVIRNMNYTHLAKLNLN